MAETMLRTINMEARVRAVIGYRHCSLISRRSSASMLFADPVSVSFRLQSERAYGISLMIMG